MGICFAKIEPAEQLHLKQLMDALSGHSVLPGKSAEGVSAQDAIASGRPNAFLDAITEFLQTKQRLSRDEFHKIA